MAGDQPYQPGDIVAVRGFRVIAIHHHEVLLHYERPSELAAALRLVGETPPLTVEGNLRLQEALRLTPHFWARRQDIVALTA